MGNTHQFSLTFEVRDYECDLQGIVNNSVYQNYLEHTRHEYIKTLNLDFARLHDENIDLVVYRSDLIYKYPLRSGDRFVCKLSQEMQGLYKIIFYQNIHRLPDNKLILKGIVTVAVSEKGKLVKSERIFH